MHSIKTRAIRGFTLIELVITLAIVGVLTAIALPQYVDYTIRVKINHAVAALKAQSVDLESRYQESVDHEFPAAPSTLSPIPGHDGGQIGWTTKSDGTAVHIEARVGADAYDGAVADTMIVYEGIADEFGNVSWRCAYHQTLTRRVKTEYEPAECNTIVSEEF